jgi:hypothetical protein
MLAHARSSVPARLFASSFSPAIARFSVQFLGRVWLIVVCEASLCVKERTMDLFINFVSSKCYNYGVPMYTLLMCEALMLCGAALPIT